MFKYQNVSKLEFVISAIFVALCMTICICLFIVANGTATFAVKLILALSIAIALSEYGIISHTYIRF